MFKCSNHFENFAILLALKSSQQSPIILYLLLIHRLINFYFKYVEFCLTSLHCNIITFLVFYFIFKFFNSVYEDLPISGVSLTEWSNRDYTL